ncbi:ribonuclease HI [Fodinibius halophilus]|uniref:Ribonuclease H n=1 Tax=Fodinibius halophilus TaxID=1736908 RepID=A0A6M1T0I5_9BACT|nr:ribonuclease HI [Fodinibius halophilus]NGP89608.1 ribonuclease HI [Fodinibius halophilus]
MSKDKQKTVIVFTDGACSGNPGPGGWGVLLQWNGVEKELTGGASHTTNNRMEMRAVIEALNAITQPCHVKIHSDSALIVNAFKQNWIKSWKKRGWKTANKKPVKNKDLWEEMLEAMKPHKVEWIKVKGHSDNVRNNRVDRLAVEASKKYQ